MIKLNESKEIEQEKVNTLKKADKKGEDIKKSFKLINKKKILK